MFSKLSDRLTTKIYIEISDKYIKVINLKTGTLYEERPLIVIGLNEKGEKTIIAIGNEASSYPDAINPFSHPRVIINDHETAELILEHAITKVVQKIIFFAPIGIIKVMRKFDTPLSHIEKVALCELSRNAGARETIILDEIDLDIHSVEYERLKEDAFCCQDAL